MKKLLFAVCVLVQYGCSNNLVAGYYEPKVEMMDESFRLDIDNQKYTLVSNKISPAQLIQFDEILTNKQLHLTSQLGTCEITGVVVLNNKLVYLTCGVSQLLIKDKHGIEIVLLNQQGSQQLFELVREFRK